MALGEEDLPKESDPVVEELTTLFELKRCKERSHQLWKEVKDFRHKNHMLDKVLAKQRDTQADVLETLHANLDERYETIQAQERQIQELHKTVIDAKEDVARLRAEDNDEAQRKISILQTKADKMAKTLAEVTRFRQEKGRIEAMIEALGKERVEAVVRHKEEFRQAERNEGERFTELKRERQNTINHARENMKTRVANKLDARTKKAIMESDEMAKELTFQCKEAERLKERNKILTEENTRLRRHLEAHREVENELVMRSHLQGQLLKRSSDLGVQLGAATTPDLDATAADVFSPKEMKTSTLRPQNRRQEAQFRRLHEELEDAKRAHRQLARDFSRYRKDHAALAQILNWGAREMATALQELRGHPAFAPPVVVGSGRFGRLLRTQKERVLLKLFDVLTAGAPLSFPLESHVEKQNMTRTMSSPALPRITGRVAPGTRPEQEQLAGAYEPEPGSLAAVLQLLQREPGSLAKIAAIPHRAEKAVQTASGGRSQSGSRELPPALVGLAPWASAGRPGAVDQADQAERVAPPRISKLQT